MKAIPDISVVMGVYNNADTLSAALDSILSQEGVELEFVVIDDGSTDGSASILDEAAKTDPRLRVVHKKNEGLTRALIDGAPVRVEKAQHLPLRPGSHQHLPSSFSAPQSAT